MQVFIIQLWQSFTQGNLLGTCASSLRNVILYNEANGPSNNSRRSAVALRFT